MDAPINDEILAKILEQSERRAAQLGPPLHRLGEAIVAQSMACRDFVKPTIRRLDGRAPLEQEAYIFFEFLYLFTHLAVREGVEALPLDILADVSKYLLHILAFVGVNSYFEHWPDDRKERIADQFKEALADRADEFGEVPFDQREQESFYGFTMVATEIALLAGQEDNLAYIERPIREQIVKSWSALEVTEHLASIFAAYTSGE